jgi:hypothetical protein
MIVFILSADANNYQNLTFLDEKDWDILQDFDGTPQKNSWNKPKVEVIRDNEANLNLPASDFPSLASHVPVFSQQAIMILNGLLKDNGEILPLSCQKGAYFAFNVTRVVDALDQSSSIVKRFKSSGRIMDIVEHKYYKDKLSNLTIFKIPQVSLMNVYVTDHFVRIVQSNSLKGFEFQKVWEG